MKLTSNQMLKCECCQNLGDNLNHCQSKIVKSISKVMCDSCIDNYLDVGTTIYNWEITPINAPAPSNKKVLVALTGTWREVMTSLSVMRAMNGGC